MKHICDTGVLNNCGCGINMISLKIVATKSIIYSIYVQRSYPSFENESLDKLPLSRHLKHNLCLKLNMCHVSYFDGKSISHIRSNNVTCQLKLESIFFNLTHMLGK